MKDLSVCLCEGCKTRRRTGLVDAIIMGALEASRAEGEEESIVAAFMDVDCIKASAAVLMHSMSALEAVGGDELRKVMEQAAGALSDQMIRVGKTMHDLLEEAELLLHESSVDEREKETHDG